MENGTVAPQPADRLPCPGTVQVVVCCSDGRCRQVTPCPESERGPHPSTGEEVRLVTYALLRPETAMAAVRALRGNTDRAAVEGLVELIHHPRTAGEAVAAIESLEPSQDPIVLDALLGAL